MVLKWLQNFFTDRTLQTKIDFSLCDIADLISGIVHGSGIGPLMFLIYINELVSVLEQYNIKVKLFADDVKMYITILFHLIQLATSMPLNQFSVALLNVCQPLESMIV